MKQLRNILLIFSLTILIYGLGFIIGWQYHQPQENEIIRVDTIKITDTIEKPIPRYVRTLRIDTLTTPKDTIYIPIEQKEYIHQIHTDSIDGSIRTVLSGYLPSLDTLQYDLSFRNKTITQRRKWGFTVGVTTGVGYGINNKVSPFIGIGITYGLNL